ncbi:transposase [Sporosarcina soli]|uniref:Transposase n=1 Tax=Sporosarcina soli TaxID=334736 RepID=A0ABW0TPM5_9BACL
MLVKTNHPLGIEKTAESESLHCKILQATSGSIPRLEKDILGQKLWAGGYFCATVGSVDEETIRNYNANQFNEEKNDVFWIDN